MRPEAEPLGLGDPLVEGEADEPRHDHPGPPRGTGEDVLPRVVASRGEPVGEQDAEERDEERAEQQEELLVARQVDAE